MQDSACADIYNLLVISFIILAVFVLEHAYFFTVALSKNIFFNRDPAWSKEFNGKLCSNKNDENKHFTLVILWSVSSTCNLNIYFNLMHCTFSIWIWIPICLIRTPLSLWEIMRSKQHDLACKAFFTDDII